MIPQLAIKLIFEGKFENQIELAIPEDSFGGSFKKIDIGLQYKSAYIEEYYLEELLEKFLVFYEGNIKPLDTLLNKADAMYLSCCVYASDTIPSICLSNELMRSILKLHEGITLDIDIVLTKDSGTDNS